MSTTSPGPGCVAGRRTPGIGAGRCSLGYRRRQMLTRVSAPADAHSGIGVRQMLTRWTRRRQMLTRWTRRVGMLRGSMRAANLVFAGWTVPGSAGPAAGTCPSREQVARMALTPVGPPTVCRNLALPGAAHRAGLAPPGRHDQATTQTAGHRRFVGRASAGSGGATPVVGGAGRGRARGSVAGRRRARSCEARSEGGATPVAWIALGAVAREARSQGGAGPGRARPVAWRRGRSVA
jgi:hypothetical protein